MLLTIEQLRAIRGAFPNSPIAEWVDQALSSPEGVAAAARADLPETHALAGFLRAQIDYALAWYLVHNPKAKPSRIGVLDLTAWVSGLAMGKTYEQLASRGAGALEE